MSMSLASETFSEGMRAAGANSNSQFRGLALGVREFLDDFAAERGLSTWKDWGITTMQGYEDRFLQEATKAPSIHFNLSFFHKWQGQIVEMDAKKLFKMKKSINFRLPGGGTITQWELQTVLRNDALRTKTSFYHMGEDITKKVNLRLGL